jgi:RNA polymerase sigma-70 factor (ECF subfamily)
LDFEALAQAHQDAVYRQMIRVCGNHADAEDVLIEALLNAYRGLHQLRDAAAFRGWLAKIARRVCWQMREREALQPLLQLSGDPPLPATTDPPDVAAARKEMHRLVWQAVNELPPEFREVYLLRDVEELPGEEVARRLGVTLAAQKSRLHRARKTLREKLAAALA